MDDQKLKIEIEGDASSLVDAAKEGVKAVHDVSDGLNQTAEAVNQTTNRFNELKNKLKETVSTGFNGFIDHAIHGLTVLAARTVIWGIEAKEAFSLEKGFADANRMFEDTADNIQGLDNDLKDLSTKKLDMPIEEIQHLAKVAGGMGKTAQEVEEFIQTASEAALSFNMPAEEMMTRLGGIQASIGLTNNQLPEFTDKVKIAADSIGGMTTEADIMGVLADGVAQAGKELGLLSGETIAYASTLLSTGTIVSNASSSLFNLFFSLRNVNGQNKEFKETLDSLGLSANQFANDIGKDPVSAINGLLGKLKQLDGTSKIQAITGLVGGNATQQAALLNLVNNLDTVKVQLKNTSDATLYAGKVHEAYEQKLDTASAKLQLMKNALSIMAASFISPFLPAIKIGIDAITDFADSARKAAENHPFIEILLKTVQIFLSLGATIHVVRWLFMPFLALLGASTIAAFNLATGLRVLLNTSIGQFFATATNSLRAFIAAQLAANTNFGAMLASSRAFFAATLAPIARLSTSLWAMVTAQVAVNINFAAMLVSARAFVIAALANIGQLITSLYAVATAQLAINLSFASALTAVRTFVIGAVAYLSVLASRLIALTTAQLSFTAILSGLAAGSRGVIAGFSGLAAAGTTLITVFKFLVGSITGLALTFLAFSIVYASDKVVEFGGVTAKVSEFFSAAWEVSAKRVKSTFNSLFDDVSKQSKVAAENAYSPWDNFLDSTGKSLYDFANKFIMAFDLIGKAIGSLLAGQGISEFLETFNTKRDYLSEFATEIGAQVKRDKASDQPNSETETRTTSGGGALSGSDNAETEKTVKSHYKQLADLQQQDIKNRQEQLKADHDYAIEELKTAYKEQELLVKKQGLSEADEKSRLVSLAKEQADKKIAIERDFILKSAALNEQAINAKIKAAKAEAAALSKPDGKSLAGLIAGGESGVAGYNAYNKGTKADGTPIPADKPLDLTALTIAEIQARQALSITNTERLGAVGKYQLIAGTLKEAVAGLKLSADAKFDAATQEKLFVYLLAEKRPSIKQYITGKSQDIAGVQANAALEFASIADPKTGQSHYLGNKASINTQQFQTTINAARASYQKNKASGMDDTAAYSQAVSGSGLSVDDQASLNNQLALLDKERVANRQDMTNQLKKLGLDEQNAQLEQAVAVLEQTKQANEEKKALDAELAQAKKESALADLDFQRQVSEQELELGQITQQEHLQRLKELAAEELALRLKLLADSRKLHLNDPVAQAKISTEQQQLMIEFRAKMGDIDLSAIKTAKQAIESLFAPLENALNQSINGILTGQQTIANAARNAAQSVVLSYIQQSVQIRLIKTRDWLFEHTGMARLLNDKKQFDLLESAWDAAMWVRKRVRQSLLWAWEISGLAGVEGRKRAIKHASELYEEVLGKEGYLRKAANWLLEITGFGAKETAKAGIAAGSEAVQTGIKATGEGTRAAIEKTTNAVSIFASAKVAGAKAYAATAGIPIIGPILAPIAAGVAFAGVMAFGSAKRGEYMVKEDGKPYILHESESVLPAGVADNFRSVVDFVKNRGLKPVDVSQVVGDLVSSGQLHGNWTIPASVSGIAQQSSEQATTMAQARRNQDTLAAEQMAKGQTINHNIYKTIKEGDVHLNVSAVDGQSVKRLFENNGDTIARVVRDKTKSGKSLKS